MAKKIKVELNSEGAIILPVKLTWGEVEILSHEFNRRNSVFLKNSREVKSLNKKFDEFSESFTAIEEQGRKT